MSNPYLEVIDEVTGKLLEHEPESLARSFQKDIFVHWDADNEWIYPTMAGFLYITVFAANHEGCPNNKTDKSKQYIISLFNQLTEVAIDNRWYHLQPRKGDRNIDRFTLVPFLEAFRQYQGELSLELRDKILHKIKNILQVQMNEYGKEKTTDNPYPNMDIYYCLIMLLGSEITGENEYYQEFLRILEILENAQFDEGAWTYINGTNECPVYHDINSVFSARIWELSREEKALNMVKKSVPYYPQIISLSGIPEYYTDPWWKHSWKTQRPMAPDVVSSLTGDRQNRWIGNKIRDDFFVSLKALNESDMATLPWIVYAAMFWQDIEEEKLLSNEIYYDKNIEGPRGKFDEWCWAATARYSSDTIVGAMDNSENPDSLSFLAGITPEIHYHPEDIPKLGGTTRLSLAITPPGTKGTTTIANDHCTFDVSYQMACFRSVWEQKPFPFNWQCQQSWRMDRQSLRGKIDVISRENQESPSPLVRIRFGRDRELQKTNQNSFKYGPFILKILETDFPSQTIEPAQVCCYLSVQDGAELVLKLEKESGKYKKEETFSLQLEINKSI